MPSSRDHGLASSCLLLVVPQCFLAVTLNLPGDVMGVSSVGMDPRTLLSLGDFERGQPPGSIPALWVLVGIYD